MKTLLNVICNPDECDDFMGLKHVLLHMKMVYTYNI